MSGSISNIFKNEFFGEHRTSYLLWMERLIYNRQIEIGVIAKGHKTKPEIKVYVVLVRSIFSSATLNAMNLKRLTNAIFVGEETSGKPNHFGSMVDINKPMSSL